MRETASPAPRAGLGCRTPLPRLWNSLAWFTGRDGPTGGRSAPAVERHPGRRRRSPVRIAGIAIVGLACAFTAGCTTSGPAASAASSPALLSSAAPPRPAPSTSHSRTPTATPRAHPVRFAAGPDDLCEPMRHHRYPPAGSGYLPRSSTVTTARWCVQDFGAHGEVVQLRQNTGSLTAVDRALHAPRIRLPATSAVCPAFVAVLVEVLDQHGRRYRPTVPTGPCGNPAVAATPSP